MKKLALFIVALFMGVGLFAQECGDCDEDYMYAPSGDASPPFDAWETYYIQPGECDGSLTSGWNYRSENASVQNVTRTSIQYKITGCSSIGYHYVEWTRQDPGTCIVESTRKYVYPQLGNGAQPEGEEEPETYYYYEYETEERAGAEGYEWTITGGSYGTTGPTDESTIMIMFFNIRTTYSIRVRPTCSCDVSTFSPALEVYTASR